MILVDASIIIEYPQTHDAKLLSIMQNNVSAQ
jgi:hypothetical protein